MEMKSLPRFERTERSGVPIFWSEVPGPTRGGLVFRVGRADETLAWFGTTHLVEHLVMFAVGRTEFAANAFIDDTRTVFYAEGTTEEVAGFLERVAAALRELPLERLDVERQVLRTEAAGATGDFLGRLLSYRYGVAAHGLSGFDELGLRWVGPDHVTGWARERFTAANAAIWMTAPPPPELALDLEPGERWLPPEPVPRPGLRHPAWVAEGTGGVAVTFVERRSLAMTAAMRVVSERAHDALRLEQGISYDIDGSYIPLTADLAHASLGADCMDENAPRVRDALQRLLEAVAADGPDAEELERYSRGFARAMEDPEWMVGALDSAAADHLYGRDRDQPEDLATELERLSAADVAAALRAALATEILLVPDGVGPPPGDFAPLRGEPDEPLEGRTFRAPRRGLRRPKTALVLGSEAIGLVGGEEGPVTIPFEDCVAVVESRRGEFDIIARDEAYISFDAGSLVDGEELERAVRENVPADRFVPPDPRATAVDEVAESKLARRWTIGDEVKQLPGLLREGERPVTMGEAARGLKAGLLVVTDQRVLWTYSALRETVDEYGYESIRSARAHGTLKKDNLTLVTDGATVKFSDVHPSDRAEELARTITERLVS